MAVVNNILLFLVAICLPMIHGMGLSYNYFDQMAQTYCQGRFVPGWVFAIRRDCGGTAPTCNDMCATAKLDILKTIKFQRKNVACFDAFRVKKDHVQLAANPTDTEPDAGKVNMVTYGYGTGGCRWRPNHCGPNYCCCKAY